MEALEKIIHPRVTEETFRLINEAWESNLYGFAVIDAPLLIEAGMHEDCDFVWVVTADTDIAVERITSRDGLTQAEALRRIGSRSIDINHYRRIADNIIENNGGISSLKDAIHNLYNDTIVKRGMA
jgi:dephospho-CoA kinase